MNSRPLLRAAAALTACAVPATAQIGSFATDGSGCASIESLGAVVYEQFGSGDLTGTSLTWTATPDGYTVQSGPLNFVTGFSNDLNLSEDQIVTVALSQPFPVPSLADLTSITIDSNGRFGRMPSSRGGENLDNFLGNTFLQICPWWDDLSPDDGGGVFFDTIGGVDVITWNQLPQMLAGDQNTFQVQMFPNGDMIWSYQSGCDDDAIVGLSTGGPFPDPGAVDFSSGLLIDVNARPAPSLRGIGTPEAGAPFSVAIDNLPSLAFLTAMNVGFNPNNLDLGPLGAPGCTILVDALTTFPAPSDRLDLSLPANPALAGAQLRFQSISFSPGANALNVITSDRGTATIGGQPLIEVFTEGPNSFNSDASSGFFRIENISAQPITRVVFDFAGSSQPSAQGLEFDTNQGGTDFADGNGTAAGCSGGTYRNGSELMAGLVFAGTDTSICDASGQIGAIRTNPVAGDPGSFRTLQFDFTSFTSGTTFEFDCDTDGVTSTTQNGADLAGMVVTITLQDGTVLMGELAVAGPELAQLRF